MSNKIFESESESVKKNFFLNYNNLGLILHKNHKNNHLKLQSA